MLHRISLILGITVLCLVLLAGVAPASPAFTEPGTPVGYDRFAVIAVSADGATLAGTAYGGPQGAAPFIWRDNVGFIGLYGLIEDNTIVSGYAVDISGDGTLVCGNVNRPAGQGVVDSKPFLWTIPFDTSQWQYEELKLVGNSGELQISVSGISRDGSTIIGSYRDSLPACPSSIYPDAYIAHGFRYVIGDSLVEPIGYLPDGECADLLYGSAFDTYVNALSGDGSVVVGSGYRLIENQFNSLTPINEAYRWDGSISGLDDITDEDHDSFAHAISDDGSIIVGIYSDRNSFGQAVPLLVRWSGGGRQGLGYPSEDIYTNFESPRNLGITGDGLVIWYDSMLSDGGSNWRSITDETATLGIGFGSIERESRIVDMSYDGNVIVGTGWDGSNTVSWRLIKDACPDYQSGQNVSEWSVAASGLFAEEQNWVDSSPPGPFSYAWFDFAGTPYTITFDRPHTVGGIRHTVGEITFDLGGHDLNIGTTFDCGPVLTSGGDDNIPVGLMLSNGRVNIKGDVELIGGDLSNFSLDDTAIVEVNGSMSVDGPPTHVVGVGDQSFLSVHEQLILGDRTDKRGELLLVGEGSQMSSRALILGNKGWGKCIVDTASLALTDSLLIGYDIGGTGELIVRGGATMQAEEITMSLLSDAMSFVTVQEAQSELLCGEIFVGVSDSARVSVVDSASLGLPDSSWIAAGIIADATGDIVVSGQGSQIDARTIDIAVAGLGDLQVLDGAQVGGGGNAIQRLNIASDSGSAGSVLVSGNFAQLLADTVVAGLGGAGILQCDPTGYVQIDDLFIGPLGNVLGSVLAIDTFDLRPVGPMAAANKTGFAVGKLTVDSGGIVSVDSVFLGPGGTLAGSAEVTLDLINDGMLAPGDSTGDAARFTIAGSYSQTVDGTLEIELQEGVSDWLAITEDATLDGTLRILLPDGFTPQPGDQYVILTAASISGTFATIEEPDDVQLDVVTTGDTIKLVVDVVTDITDGPTDGQLPDTYALYQNYPNPFNPSTTIAFSLPVRSQVELEIINIAGRRVRTLVDESLPAGQHTVVWDGHTDGGAPSASGVYFYRLKTDDAMQSKKMILLK